MKISNTKRGSAFPCNSSMVSILPRLMNGIFVRGVVHVGVRVLLHVWRRFGVKRRQRFLRRRLFQRRRVLLSLDGAGSFGASLDAGAIFHRFTGVAVLRFAATGVWLFIYLFDQPHPLAFDFI